MNILIHAVLYPESETTKRQNTTMFIHYYAAEWARNGHSVLVIHHKVRFPRVLVTVGRRLSGALRLTRVQDYLNGYGEDADAEFVRDGVTVVRRGITKLVPRTLYSGRAIAARARMTQEILEAHTFQPDITICDFINPGLFVALAARTGGEISAVLHNTDMEYFARGVTSRHALAAVGRADRVIFRSETAQAAFSQRYFAPEHSMIMMSGVPRELVRPAEQIRMRRKIRRFISVCRFVPTKHADRLIAAFGALTCPDVELVLVGDGVERENLQKLAAGQKNADRIRFTGAIVREKVFEEMERADCFVLISEKETFGMAYVEAMSTGAIPVGSRDEGVSAFVKDGENGFLIPAGDGAALRRLMERMLVMTEEEVASLSENAAASTRNLRDDVLARRALEELSGQR